MAKIYNGKSPRENGIRFFLDRIKGKINHVGKPIPSLDGHNDRDSKSIQYDSQRELYKEREDSSAKQEIGKNSSSSRTTNHKRHHERRERL